MKKLITLFALMSLSFSAISQIPGGMGGFGAAPKKETVIPGTAQAAPKGSAKIIGFLLDSTDSKPVEFATLALINTKTNKPVDGTVADGVGKFTLNKVAVGSYKIVVSFIGYESKTVFVTVSEKKDDHDLGVIKMQQSSKMLSEVTVEGQRALIEERVDRTVYNAEKIGRASCRERVSSPV